MNTKIVLNDDLNLVLWTRLHCDARQNAR